MCLHPQALPKAKRLEYLKAAAENDLGPIREMLKAQPGASDRSRDEQENSYSVYLIEDQYDMPACLYLLQGHPDSSARVPYRDSGVRDGASHPASLPNGQAGHWLDEVRNDERQDRLRRYSA